MKGSGDLDAHRDFLFMCVFGAYQSWKRFLIVRFPIVAVRRTQKFLRRVNEEERFRRASFLQTSPLLLPTGSVWLWSMLRNFWLFFSLLISMQEAKIAVLPLTQLFVSLHACCVCVRDISIVELIRALAGAVRDVARRKVAMNFLVCPLPGIVWFCLWRETESAVCWNCGQERLCWRPCILQGMRFF